MKVRELIELLKAEDPEAVVVGREGEVGDTYAADTIQRLWVKLDDYGDVRDTWHNPKINHTPAPPADYLPAIEIV